MKTGLVIKSTGSWYKVKHNFGITNCKIKGKFRLEGIRSTNPIAVGDVVTFEIQREDDTGIITKIAARKNYIIRKSTNLSRKGHILAANIDQAILLVSMSKPRTSAVFIDRFLTSADAYRIPTRIVFNKLDIYSDKEMEQMQQLIATYEKIGYPCHQISAIEQTNLDEIKGLLQNKISLITGNSGVGKSTLINVIDPDLELKTDAISDYHLKGKHTTTFYEMFELVMGGYIIDSPGIKGFGLVDFEKEKISHHFPEMFERLSECRFHNCTHTHEPGCAVKQAIDEGEISQSRYNSYLSILADDDEKYREDIYR